MPLMPMSASPRAIDWSMELKATLTNCGVRRSPRASRSAISTSKPTTIVRMRRIGLDKRRAAFGIARPAEDGRRLRGVLQSRVVVDRRGSIRVADQQERKKQTVKEETHRDRL